MLVGALSAVVEVQGKSYYTLFLIVTFVKAYY